MPYTSGEAQFFFNYSVSPITLNNGIAGGVVGGAMSITSILQAASFNGLTSSSDIDINEFFANFMPQPGSTLIDNQIGNYPFANLAIAANAIINQPLQVSLLMRVPASAFNGGYAGKLAIMTSLQNTLAQHTAQEGTFTVATPSFYYTNCILLHLTDISGGETNQTQVTWRWDFVQPLITLDQASVAENQMMSALSSGGPADGSPSGVGGTVGFTPGVSSSAQSPVSSASFAGSLPAFQTSSAVGGFGLSGPVALQ